MSLVDFLLARIAEDAAAARLRKVGGHFEPDPRALAECEAKRRIVEFHRPFDQSGVIARRTLELLAQPYADHPDFDPTWT